MTQPLVKIGRSLGGGGGIAQLFSDNKSDTIWGSIYLTDPLATTRIKDTLLPDTAGQEWPTYKDKLYHL